MSDFFHARRNADAEPYEKVGTEKVSLDFTYQPEYRMAVIEKVIPDRQIVRPGDTVNVTVKIRPYGKPLETQQIAVKVPAYTSEPIMAILVAGGANGIALNPYMYATPAPEEGVKGIVRWLTKTPPAQSLLTVQLFPTPSYGYRGTVMNELPAPFFDMVRLLDSNGATQNPDSDEGPVSNIRPATFSSSQKEPYILKGGQVIMVAIDTPEQRSNIKGGQFNFGGQAPLLSNVVTSGTESPAENGGPPGNASSVLPYCNWLTPAQRAQFTALFGTTEAPSMPQWQSVLHSMGWDNIGAGKTLPLSFAIQGLDDKLPSPTPDDDAKAAKTDKSGGEGAMSGVNTADDGAAPANDETPSNAEKEANHNDALLTHTRPSWGLTSRGDFLRGTQIGTTVTMRGALTLMPKVESIYHTNDMAPWKIAATTNGIYFAGWGSNKIVHLTDGGKSDVFFAAKPDEAGTAQNITALVADASGDLLVSSWPDQQVRLLAPDGSLLQSWTLPGNSIWDIVIGSDGKRYAACDHGTLYLLSDDKQAPLKVACSVPDKSVYALAAAPNGDIYLATSPCGKVYRLATDGTLSSIFEAKDSVSSLAVDAQGNLYVGTSPSCSVYRVSPDGARQKIMAGVGIGNHHVLALKIVGDTLYAATGPAGGIYRITQPAGQQPDVIAIYAREDKRDGTDEQVGAGLESTMVNALAVTTRGEVVAAASSPGQVLRLEPRAQGTYLSAVLPAPAVSSWGELEMYATPVHDAATPAGADFADIETRSGCTSWPDATWSSWTPLKDGKFIDSPAATYAQLRITLSDPSGNRSLAYLRAYYTPANQPPTLRIVAPTAGTYWSGTKVIRWEGKDLNGNDLVYSISASPDNGQTWGNLIVTDNSPAKPTVTTPPATPPSPPAPPTVEKKSRHHRSKKSEVTPAATDTKADTSDAKPAATDTKADASDAKPAATDAKADAAATSTADTTTKPPTPPTPTRMNTETAATSFSWDTSKVPDGDYILRISASNKYARRLIRNRRNEISGHIIIENTPPTISLKDTETGWDAVKQFDITDKLTPVVGGKFRIDDGTWTALVAQDGVFDKTTETVLLYPPDDPAKLTPGEHKLEINAADAADNIVKRTITFVVK